MKQENDSSRIDHDSNPQTIAYSPVEPDYQHPQIPNENYLIYGQPVPGLNQNLSYPQPYQAQYPLQAVPPFHPGAGPQNLAVVGVEQIILTEKENKILKFAKVSRIASLVNLIIDLLILISVPGSGIIIIGNVFGIISTNRFNKCLAITYIIYLFLLILTKILVIGFIPILTVIIVFPVLIILNGIVSGIFIVFVRKMYKSQQMELDRCRKFYISTKRCKCCY